MKKINATLIALVLIAIHVLVFMVVIGTKNDNAKPRAKLHPNQPAQTNPKPIEIKEFVVPEVAIPAAPPLAPMPKIEPAPIQNITRTAAPTTSHETIATAGTRSGYIRADRPSNRTRESFPKLIRTPYRSAIVVDARTGKILHEDRASSYAYPASVTKLMTMLLTLEQVDAGKISLQDKVNITKEGVSMRNSRPSQVFLDTRESGHFTVEDMLNAVMIHSACDASQVLGIHVGGSRAAFIEMMNQKARKLGMNSTNYHTEHGLPPVDGSQPDISTAYDIAILSLACLRHPETLKYTSTNLTYLPLTPIRKEKFMLANRNALISKKKYEGCDGLKTGYHSKGGWSLAATAKRGNNRVVAVVLGCTDKNTRDIQIRKLLDKGFEKLK